MLVLRALSASGTGSENFRAIYHDSTQLVRPMGGYCDALSLSMGHVHVRRLPSRGLSSAVVFGLI